MTQTAKQYIRRVITRSDGNSIDMSINVSPVIIAADYTITDEDAIISADATTASFTITLLPCADSEGLEYFFKKTDSSANTITLQPDGAEEIDGETSAVLYSQYDYIKIKSTGTGWEVTGSTGGRSNGYFPQGW